MTIFYVNQDAFGANDGTSWANAYNDLQSALEVAGTNDEIWVGEGTYKPTNDTNRGTSFIIPNGVKIYGGFTGTETNLSQRDWQNNMTILSGDIGRQGVKTDNSLHVLYLGTTTNSTVIDGFTISDGYATDGRASSSFGGAVFLNGSNGTFRNLIIEDNEAFWGGGFYMQDSSPTLINVIFKDNFATSRGGAIYHAYFAAKVPTIINSLFVSNESQEGGAIYSNGLFGNIINTTFYSNQAQTGSVIYHTAQQTESPKIENSIFWDNSGDGDNWFVSPNNIQFIINNSIVEGGYDGPSTNVIESNPLFVNPSNNDFRLQKNSPGINAGNNQANSSNRDIVDNPRIFNNTIDLGAYEYGLFMSINDVSVVEGDSGTTNANFTVTLRDTLGQSSTNPVTVNYTTGDQTASTGDSDYQFVNSSLTFNSGEVEKTITVPVIGDTKSESDELFSVNLSNLSGADFKDSQGLGTILNDDVTLNTPINRFQNTQRPGTYLFAGEAESTNIRQNFRNFTEEGVAFKVATQPADGLIAMTRFQNTAVPGTYLYAGEAESANIRQNFPNFVEEGIAFYVYDGNANKGVDFYRLQNTQQPGTYLFAGEEEKNNILANFPNFKLEGVAFEVGA